VEVVVVVVVVVVCVVLLLPPLGDTFLGEAVVVVARVRAAATVEAESGAAVGCACVLRGEDTGELGREVDVDVVVVVPARGEGGRPKLVGSVERSSAATPYCCSCTRRDSPSAAWLMSMMLSLLVIFLKDPWMGDPMASRSNSALIPFLLRGFFFFTTALSSNDNPPLAAATPPPTPAWTPPSPSPMSLGEGMVVVLSLILFTSPPPSLSFSGSSLIIGTDPSTS